jgi:hypothetical protein
VLHSNGTATYWAADDNSGGTVTSVATGNGLTGGTITTTGTVSILANTGIVANATGVFVNATYIGTISANNASFLGGTAAASYALLAGPTFTGTVNVSSGNFYSNNLLLQGDGTNAYIRPINSGSVLYLGANNNNHVSLVSNGNLGIGNTAPNARLAVTGTANISGNVAIAGITTFTGNVVLGSVAVSSNGGLGTAGQVLTSNGTATYWSTVTATVNTAAQFTWTNTHTFNSNTTFGNSTFANTTVTSFSGYSNPQALTSGVLQTNASLNTLLVGPYTVSSGNSLVIATGSRLVII